MAEFAYKSRIYGEYCFFVKDEGGIVELFGRRLTSFGGYLIDETDKHALRADASTLESSARRWWRLRTNHLSALGHKANGVRP